ncbi:hypothetical protein [Neolewinella agarilytica]|uniref:Effector-associated domain-containing protein n=1 Tax=Neolewinella agarilytica TaxID=478744 RepID=A0A1H8YWL5_9BACT|nr:hypothetical protein [Neolewinella agarilytica]SEP56600.1 hypothetical protein SAMN05444359_10155 [Neolewinella agarilytica]
MTKDEKSHFLSLIEADDYRAVIDELTAFLPEGHPDRKRIVQLGKRERELSDRIEMGTLSKEDIGRVQNRIKGGLRDSVHEIERRPAIVEEEAPKEEKEVFKLDLSPEPEKKEEEITKGFFGEVEYTGSPSMKDQTIILHKSYGAAYHTCREAIRQAGMQMESGDRDGGRLKASIPGTGTGSFGEKILIWVTPMEGGKTKVYVVVDSQLPTQVFDFGRNKLKLGILCSYIR